MSRDQAESCCGIQSKLDALLRNSINQDKAVAEKTVKHSIRRVDFTDRKR